MIFLFDLSLEARAEILEMIMWVFWEKRSFHKDIIKLRLYPRILRINERTNLVFLPNSTKNEFVRSFFGRIRGYQRVLSKLTDLYIMSNRQ